MAHELALGVELEQHGIDVGAGQRHGGAVAALDAHRAVGSRRHVQVAGEVEGGGAHAVPAGAAEHAGPGGGHGGAGLGVAAIGQHVQVAVQAALGERARRRGIGLAQGPHRIGEAKARQAVAAEAQRGGRAGRLEVAASLGAHERAHVGASRRGRGGGVRGVVVQIEGDLTHPAQALVVGRHVAQLVARRALGREPVAIGHLAAAGAWQGLRIGRPLVADRAGDVEVVDLVGIAAHSMMGRRVGAGAAGVDRRGALAHALRLRVDPHVEVHAVDLAELRSGVPLHQERQGLAVVQLDHRAHRVVFVIDDAVAVAIHHHAHRRAIRDREAAFGERVGYRRLIVGGLKRGRDRVEAQPVPGPAAGAAATGEHQVAHPG
uniref:Uncharacterized protein n=1 Tax=uncultured bacterium A1Q1_fos_1870 TaxID=1256554 RepID=L7VY37_9BACT|nr:hypothetical protein [uncultured bacterium A1Q1_fos_1870]